MTALLCMQCINCLHHVNPSLQRLILHLSEASVPGLHNVYLLSSACWMYMAMPQHHGVLPVRIMFMS
jgi:hypothetical protein